MSARKRPSEHASAPERWNYHPPHARVDLEQRDRELEREQVQEQVEQARGFLMKEKLPEAGCVRLHLTGHKRKLDQVQLPTG